MFLVNIILMCILYVCVCMCVPVCLSKLMSFICA